MTDNPMLAENKPGLPPAEVEVDVGLVRALLARQHPDLAGRSVSFVDEGWDNLTFRIGEDLAARLPRREVAVELLANETRWLPELAPRLPWPVPTPIRGGAPGCGYPWAWSIVPWLDGETANLAKLRPGQGRALAEFLRALHQPAPVQAPRNPARGVPLADRRASVEERLERLAGRMPGSIRSLWSAALAAPIDASDTWLHGDLHSRNVLVADGRFSAALDWGDLCAGDPASDLASIWLLLDERAERLQALEAYGGVTPATRARAIGWAILIAAVLLETGLQGNPRQAETGRLVLARIAQDGLAGPSSE